MSADFAPGDRVRLTRTPIQGWRHLQTSPSWAAMKWRAVWLLLFAGFVLALWGIGRYWRAFMRRPLYFGNDRSPRRLKGVDPRARLTRVGAESFAVLALDSFGFVSLRKTLRSKSFCGRNAHEPSV